MEAVERATGLEGGVLTRLRRFLCFGTGGGAYCAGRRRPDVEKATATLLLRLLDEGLGGELVQEVRRMSLGGGALEAGPSLFSLALCSQHADHEARHAAYRALRDVCVLPEHLFAFVKFRKERTQGRGGGMWGRGLRRAVADWYNGKEAMELARDATKCKRKMGWSHKDLLRLSHMKPANPALAVVCRYITKGWKELQATRSDWDSSGDVGKVLRYLEAAERAKRPGGEVELARLISEHGLQREQLLPRHLECKEVCGALLGAMPLGVLLGQLGKMTAGDVLARGSPEAAFVCERLQDDAGLQKAKLHPFETLAALHAYRRGRGNGATAWEADQDVTRALEAAFSKCFANVKPTGKRLVVAADVFPSAGCGTFGCCVGAAAVAATMSMAAARTEVEPQFLVFSEGTVVPCSVTADMSLAQVTTELVKLPSGGTDCALAVLWATEKEQPTDVFMVFTNNHTRLGEVSAAEALRIHREMFGASPKLIVCRLDSSGPPVDRAGDADILDVCGFDSGALQVIQSFTSDLL